MVTPDEFGTLMIETPLLNLSRQRKLDDLEQYLKENGAFTYNPLEYIHIHYNGDLNRGIEQKSLKELWIFLRDKGIDYATYDGLHKFLKATGFTFRPNTEQTEKGRTGLQSGKSNIGRLKNNLIAFQDALNNVISGDKEEKSNFDFKYYKNMRHPIDKVLYLLGMNEESLGKIKEITLLGSQAIMTAINTTLVDTIRKLRNDGFEIEDIKISKGSIHNLLSKLNS